MPDTLIQCIGNRLRRDDGAGPYVADLLQQADLAEHILIQEHWGEGSELMQYWDDAANVILIDSASSASTPGALHVFDAGTQEIPRDFFYYSSHRFGVAEAVEVARALGQLPKSLQLYAIEGAEFSQGQGLSPAVAAAADTLATDLIRKWTQRKRPDLAGK